MPIPYFWHSDQEVIERWRTVQLRKLAALNGTLIEELRTPCTIYPIQPCELSGGLRTWAVTPHDESADKALRGFVIDRDRPVQPGFAIALWMKV